MAKKKESITTVDDYIRTQSSPQREILLTLRALIRDTVPGITEEMKMGVPWYEGKFYLVSLKDHVNMGFAYTSMLSEYQQHLRGKGRYMRHVRFSSKEEIDTVILKKLIKATKKGYTDPHAQT